MNQQQTVFHPKETRNEQRRNWMNHLWKRWILQDKTLTIEQQLILKADLASVKNEVSVKNQVTEISKNR